MIKFLEENIREIISEFKRDNGYLDRKLSLLYRM